jgi:hypothetical protein
MKKFYIHLIALLMVSGTMAQNAQPCSTCLPEGITFTTQAQIDNFQTNYPNCTELEGDVIIEGRSIINLNGLSILESIGGSLYIYIYNNPALTSLTGLDNVELDSISDLTIYFNPLLSTCAIQSICDYLASPNGLIYIHDNAQGCNSNGEVRAACKEGVDESSVVNRRSSLSIYPNPASTNITISTPTTPYKNTILTIRNLNGQALFSRQIIEQQTVVDVSVLSQGVYFVKVSDDRMGHVGKFVKQ